MTELGVWLGVVGVCDLVRAARDVTSFARRSLIAAIGLALLLFTAVALGLSPSATLWTYAGWAATFLLWLLGSAAALSRPLSRYSARGRTVAFCGLAAGVLFGLLAGGRAEISRSAPGALAGVPAEQLVLVCGVLAVQLSTANVVVRLLLDAVGVPASTNEKQLRGGRLLGPMERVAIVGLGVAGQLTAASVVVAAKGLLRFPELQRGSRRAGPSDVTEYFLIGSFASWLTALGGLALLAVVQR